MVQANSTLSLEREAAMINDATLESTKAPGALDFDLQVQDMSKVRRAPDMSCTCGMLSNAALQHSCCTSCNMPHGNKSSPFQAGVVCMQHAVKEDAHTCLHACVKRQTGMQP